MLNWFKLPSILLLDLIKGDTSVVVLIVLGFGVEFLCCLHLMYAFIVKLGLLSGRLLGNSCSLGLRY